MGNLEVPTLKTEVRFGRYVVSACRKPKKPPSIQIQKIAGGIWYFSEDYKT